MLRAFPCHSGLVLFIFSLAKSCFWKRADLKPKSFCATNHFVFTLYSIIIGPRCQFWMSTFLEHCTYNSYLPRWLCGCFSEGGEKRKRPCVEITVHVWDPQGAQINVSFCMDKAILRKGYSADMQGKSVRFWGEHKCRGHFPSPSGSRNSTTAFEMKRTMHESCCSFFLRGCRRPPHAKTKPTAVPY